MQVVLLATIKKIIVAHLAIRQQIEQMLINNGVILISRDINGNLIIKPVNNCPVCPRQDSDL